MHSTVYIHAQALKLRLSQKSLQGYAHSAQGCYYTYLSIVHVLQPNNNCYNYYDIDTMSCIHMGDYHNKSSRIRSNQSAVVL